MADRTAKSILKLPRLPRFRRKFRMRTPGSITALEIDGQVLRVVQTSQRINRAPGRRDLTRPFYLGRNPADVDPRPTIYRGARAL